MNKCMLTHTNTHIPRPRVRAHHTRTFFHSWHIRLVAADGAAVSRWRAWARYLLSWLWFLPATAAVYLAGLHGRGEVVTALLAGVLAYAALVWLRPDRQFWHDVVCGTRLVDCKPALPTKAKSRA